MASTSTATAKPHAVPRREWRTRLIRIVTILRCRDRTWSGYVRLGQVKNWHRQCLLSRQRDHRPPRSRDHREGEAEVKSRDVVYEVVVGFFDEEVQAVSAAGLASCSVGVSLVMALAADWRRFGLGSTSSPRLLILRVPSRRAEVRRCGVSHVSW